MSRLRSLVLFTFYCSLVDCFHFSKAVPGRGRGRAGLGMTRVDDDSIPIRTFSKDSNDRSNLLALVRELQAHEHALDDRMKDPSDLGMEYVDRLLSKCALTSGKILVAESTDGGGLVGYAVVLCRIVCQEYDEVQYEYGEISELAVTASWRGRGIGSRLLQMCEEAVRAHGVKYLRTTALAKNAGALQLYERNGFRERLVELEKKL